MLKSIHDIYSRDETFLDYFAHDLDDFAVWFNNSEFARFHDINGKQILSIFTADTRSQALSINIGDEVHDINKSRGVLFCRAREMKCPNAGQSLKVNGKLYIVSEARLLQDQVCRIVLEANSR